MYRMKRIPTNGDDGFDPNKSTVGLSSVDENNMSSPNNDRVPAFDCTETHTVIRLNAAALSCLMQLTI